MNVVPRISRSYLEILLTLFVLVWLFWQGRVFNDADIFREANDRYRHDIALRIELSPELKKSNWLLRVDEKQAKHAEQKAVATIPDWIQKELQAMEVAHKSWSQAFFVPLQSTIQQRDEWEVRAREGFVDNGWEETFNQLMEKTHSYRETYQLRRVERGAAYSTSFECAWVYLNQYITTQGKRQIDALRGLAALLDGNSNLLDGRNNTLPLEVFSAKTNWQEGKKDCRSFNTPLEAYQLGINIIRKARSAANNADKAEALISLMPKACWHFVTWTLLGLLILSIGRLAVRLDRFLSLALVLWAILAALTQPQLQWLGGGNAFPMMVGLMPAFWLTVAAVIALLVPLKKIAPVSSPASALGYPGFVLFAGLSWWLLFDIAANGYFDKRFLGLYQQAYLFVAFVLVSILPAFRFYFASLGLKILSFWPLVAAGKTFRALVSWGVAFCFVIAWLLAIGFLFKGHRQLTSEIFRFALIVGMAWFLLVRADKLISPWLRTPPKPPTSRHVWWHGQLPLAPIRLKLAIPVMLLFCFVMAALFLTDDNGPLLVVLFATGIFIGLGVAALAAKKLSVRIGLIFGMLTVPIYVWAGSFALLNYGQLFGHRIGERLESSQNPFLAGNDQLARVLWFQEIATENGGFGFGHVPWCGELSSSSCGGVPPQIQSDYIYTALIGVYGPWASGLLLLLLVLWLWRMVRSHPAITSGQTVDVHFGQAWLSWLTLCWVGMTLTQLAVTVAGNLGWLPLTGITFPFLSFGFWSLLSNVFFLAMAINLNKGKA